MIATSFVRRFVLVGLIGLSALLSCTAKKVAGTATDAENTVAGAVVDSLGKPMVGIQVSLVADPLGWSNSMPLAKKTVTSLDSLPANRMVVTDAKGQFEFDKVDSTLEFSLSFVGKDSATKNRVQLLKSMTLATANRSYETVHLVKSATLVGHLSYDRSNNPLYQFSDQFRVGIEGSGRTVPVVAGQDFVLDNVASGSQNVVVYPADQYLVQSLMNAGVPLDSLVLRAPFSFTEGDTLNVGNMTWKIPLSFTWLYKDSVIVQRRMMHGVTLTAKGAPIANVQIRVIQDSMGYTYSVNGLTDSYPVSDTTVAYSDSLGHWSLPVPSTAHFNLEFLSRNAADSLLLYGVSSGLKTGLDTSLAIVDTLKPPAVLHGMVIYTEEPGAWIHIGTHFKVGIKGTSRFMDVSAGQVFDLRGLPAGQQMLLFYPGDSFLWQTFADTLGTREAMIGGVQFVVFTSGVSLGQQNVTYTLPTKP